MIRARTWTTDAGVEVEEGRMACSIRVSCSGTLTWSLEDPAVVVEDVEEGVGDSPSTLDRRGGGGRKRGGNYCRLTEWREKEAAEVEDE